MRCQGITKKGSQCRRDVRVGTHCYQHSGGDVCKAAPSKPKSTNESYGIGAEALVSAYYGLESPPNWESRTTDAVLDELRPHVISMMESLEKRGVVIDKYCGRNSKVDFRSGNITISMKTIRSNKVCPSMCQPSRKRFAEDYNFEFRDDTDIKHFIVDNIETILARSFDRLFETDFTCILFKRGDVWDHIIISKRQGLQFKRNLITFTRPVDKWNESNTVKFDRKSIGEFQIHNNRDNIKFRFNLSNIMTIMTH